VLTACIFISDPAAVGHAIIFPRFPVIVSRVIESIKAGWTLRINAGRGERGLLWQPRFFDRALRSLKEYYEKVEYIHLNPVRAGLVKRTEDWLWSSMHVDGRPERNL
jgi:REP element-mobilizing transposase RayT